MDPILNPKVLKQIRKVFVAAMDLKASYDKKEANEVISAHAKLYLSEYDHLAEELPKELLEITAIDRATNYIRNKPWNTYSDVNNVCKSYLFRVEDEYFKFAIGKFNETLQSLFK